MIHFAGVLRKLSIFTSAIFPREVKAVLDGKGGAHSKKQDVTEADAIKVG